MKGYLVFDIEAVVDPELEPALCDRDKGEGKMPAVPFWKVVCIGAAHLGLDYQLTRLGIVAKGMDEREQVLSFINYLGAFDATVVTFNGRGFDLPLIAARAMRYGIPFPAYFSGNRPDPRYRYQSRPHCDLMDQLSDYGATKQGRLDVWSKLIGAPGKLEGDAGAEVAQMVADGRLEDCQNYCLTDVMQTAMLFLRFEYIRSSMSLDTYRAAMGSLLDTVKKRPELRKLDQEIGDPRVRRLMMLLASGEL